MSDCMTQEDAERMGASQAIQILKPLRAMMLDQHGCPISDAYFALGKAIEALEQPTVNAVPVVRCRNCKWYKTMYCKMDRWTDLVTVYVAKKDDYCSYGERREKDEL